jgi:hypothetical protein
MNKSNNKSLQDFLENHLKNHPNMPMEEFAEFIRLYSPKLDINKLITREHRNKACYIARKVKNKTGDRRVYANKKKALWVDIESENDKENLVPIRKDLEHQAVGARKAYNFITARMAELSGQTVLEFEQGEISV